MSDRSSRECSADDRAGAPSPTRAPAAIGGASSDRPHASRPGAAGKVTVSPPGRAAVVVLNWNGGAALLDCLESVRRSDYPDFATILADNGSHDGSPTLAAAWANARQAGGEDVRYVRYDRAQAEAGGDPEAEARLSAVPASGRLAVIEIGANLGYAAGNNVALKYAVARGFQYVMLLNNDAAVEPATLGALVASLERHPEWAGVAPKVVAASDPRRILYAGGEIKLWQARGVHLGRNRSDGPRWSGVRQTRHLSGCCALYRTGFLRDAGLLDEEFFFGHEDVALSLVAAERGATFGVDLGVRATHAEGGSLGRSSRSVYYYNKYRLLLVRKHANGWEAMVAGAFLVTSRLGKFVFLLITGRPGRIRAEARSYLDFFAGRLAAFDRAQANKPGEEP